MKLAIFFLLLTISYFVAAQLLIVDQQTFYIKSTDVRVRSGPSASSSILGYLNLNDEVVMVEPNPSPEEKYVEIRIIKTKSPIAVSEKYFIAKEYLASRPIDYKTFNGKYFIVLNIASETLRLYERSCIDLECSNKMIMETEIVVGEDKNLPKESAGKGRSILGSYRVTNWLKFYEDAEIHYPAWYKENYPDLPAANSRNIGLWLSKRYMPTDEHGRKRGKMRGAFGWYTMLLEPDAFGQWVHGTVGWGADNEYYIKAIKKFLPNIFSDPRSSGCNRNNNEAIAYLRHVVELGAPVVKIYAEEKIFDPNLSGYPNASKEWKYILTKNRNSGADREEVLRELGLSSEEVDRYWEIIQMGDVIVLDPKNPLNQIIEVGTYELDTHPDVIRFTPGERMSRLQRKINRTGNIYGIKSRDMSGVYYIDTGTLSNYRHPSTILETGGYPDEETPSWMMAK